METALAVVCGLLIAPWLLLWDTGSRCTGFSIVPLGLQSGGLVVVVHRLSCPSMCNLLRPGIEPVSPVLAGRFLTTGPSGKSVLKHFNS